jgi:hypothetical protein
MWAKLHSVWICTWQYYIRIGRPSKTHIHSRLTITRTPKRRQPKLIAGFTTSIESTYPPVVLAAAPGTSRLNSLQSRGFVHHNQMRGAAAWRRHSTYSTQQASMLCPSNRTVPAARWFDVTRQCHGWILSRARCPMKWGPGPACTLPSRLMHACMAGATPGIIFIQFVLLLCSVVDAAHRCVLLGRALSSWSVRQSGFRICNTLLSYRRNGRYVL